MDKPPAMLAMLMKMLPPGLLEQCGEAAAKIQQAFNEINTRLGVIEAQNAEILALLKGPIVGENAKQNGKEITHG